jgi:predicted protein tyrosine phosphatase
MPFIQNCAAVDISSGMFYRDPGENSMLISIVDPASWRPDAKHNFKERYDFEFLDIEANDYSFEEDWKFSEAQAAEIVKLLHRALDNNMNVIVHCFAGVSRSGAVCEIGVSMGFEDVGEYRHPNLLVKHRLTQALGLYKK